jgi:hypothetical protein
MMCRDVKRDGRKHTSLVSTSPRLSLQQPQLASHPHQDERNGDDDSTECTTCSVASSHTGRGQAEGHEPEHEFADIEDQVGFQTCEPVETG